MNKEEWLKKFSLIKGEFESYLLKKQSSTEVERKFLSKKGDLILLLRDLSLFNNEEKKELGKIGNELRNKILEYISLNKTKEEILNTNSKIDLTLKGKPFLKGTFHPILATMDKIISTMNKLGFSLEDGPLVETDYYNFEALNFPKDHPAREMQDTFYLNIKDENNIPLLLRTHTSSVQIRTMKNKKPPLRVISSGKVFRSEAIDASHSFVFHQLEGFYVDKNVSMADLKWTLSSFIKDLFGNEAKVKFSPSYFPFVEPGAQVEVSCMFCSKYKGKCPVCKGTGWIEMLGAGMIHPKVFENCNYNPDEVSGFAFGAGIERFAMLLYGISDMRILYENDLRVLKNL